MSENEKAFIQIREISKHFGDVIAVNKVDLDIKKGNCSQFWVHPVLVKQPC